MYLVFYLLVLHLSSSQQTIPDWIKQTAGWYSDGIVTEKEFLDAILYLVQNKIIILDEQTLEDPILKITEQIISQPKTSTI